MIIAVASGKGGTGKTTIAVSLALSIENVQFFDCDVEEPNAHIFLKPVIKETFEAFISVPEIIKEKCTLCGKCAEICAYNAIAVIKGNKNKKVLVFNNICHGCGACFMLCPNGAIKEVDRKIGVVEKSIAGNIDFIQGKLDIGEPMSPPIIRQIKNNIDKSKTVIIDSPPGTSCPVITAVKDSDFCLLVTEPTPFGLNDLKLAINTVRKINIPYGVVINRSNLGDDKTEKYCIEENVPVLMKIPFDRKIAEAYSKGYSIVDKFPEYKSKFLDLFLNISNKIGG